MPQLNPTDDQKPETRWANRGDWIEATLSDGRRLLAQLNTAETCAFGNHLIASGRWRVIDQPSLENLTCDDQTANRPDNS